MPVRSLDPSWRAGFAFAIHLAIDAERAFTSHTLGQGASQAITAICEAARREGYEPFGR